MPRKLALWTSLALGVSLAAAFAWVHFGLGRVLEARNDAFLQRKAAELLAGVADDPQGGRATFDAEILREVMAYEGEGLVVVVREGGRTSVAPDAKIARLLAGRPVPAGRPRTVRPLDSGPRYRVLVSPSRADGLSLELGISLAETEATLAEFDRFVAGGAVASLVLAVVGGLFLSRQALRPVAESIATARRLDPGNLSERLPLTGAGDELDELAGTINGLLDRLASFHAQVIRFTADASHELRSPLGAMRAAVEVALQRPRTDSEYRETLSSLGEQCEGLTALVNGLLLLARADAGEVAVDRKPLDLASLAADVGEMYEPLAEERGIGFRWECPTPAPILGDAQRLRQLVTNLVDNAMKFTPPGGSVLLTVRGDGQEARMTLTDTGVGIKAGDLSRVFDRFFQADTARTSAGSGLGLSICQWIVKAHDGAIEITSREGQGTRFTVALPQEI